MGLRGREEIKKKTTTPNKTYQPLNKKKPLPIEWREIKKEWPDRPEKIRTRPGDRTRRKNRNEDNSV